MTVSFHFVPNLSVTLLFRLVLASFDNVGAFYWPTKKIIIEAFNENEAVLPSGRDSVIIALLDTELACEG